MVACAQSGTARGASTAAADSALPLRGSSIDEVATDAGVAAATAGAGFLDGSKVESNGARPKPLFDCSMLCACAMIDAVDGTGRVGCCCGAAAGAGAGAATSTDCDSVGAGFAAWLPPPVTDGSVTPNDGKPVEVPHKADEFGGCCAAPDGTNATPENRPAVGGRALLPGMRLRARTILRAPSRD